MPEQVEQPHIQVIMRDGTVGYFAPQVLNVMLDHDEVLKFKRMSGWVTVGVDPIRHKHRKNGNFFYNGPERRYYK
jgi:hypothetical protein